MNEGRKQGSEGKNGDSTIENLNTPTSIDPHIRDKLYALNSGAKLSPYLSSPEDPIQMEAARRVVTKDLEETRPEARELTRDLTKAESLVSQISNEEEEQMEIYIDNLKRRLNMTRESQEILSNYQAALDYGIKNLPEEKFKVLMEVVETEASIIQRIAEGRAIIRHIEELGTLKDAQKVKDEATEYILDHLEGMLKEQPDEVTLLFEDDIKNLYQKIKSKQITPTPEEYAIAEQIFEEWVLEAAINRAGVAEKGIGDDASLTLTDPLAQIARGMSDLD